MSKEDLIPFNKMSKERAREIQVKGGKQTSIWKRISAIKREANKRGGLTKKEQIKIDLIIKGDINTYNNIIKKGIQTQKNEYQLFKIEAKKILKHIKKCQECGYKEHPKILETHHIIHIKNGGTNKKHNLIKLCPNCHALKHRK